VSRIRAACGPSKHYARWSGTVFRGRLHVESRRSGIHHLLASPISVDALAVLSAFPVFRGDLVQLQTSLLANLIPESRERHNLLPRIVYNAAVLTIIASSSVRHATLLR
jgi:hypothetical protein